MSFLDHHSIRARMNEKCPESRPREEHYLHNAHRKASFQHGAGFVEFVVEFVRLRTV